MVYKEGRHFVLHLMKFVFQITGRLFPEDMQKLLDEFPVDEESKFSVNITKAIMVFVSEYLDFGAEVADISTHEFQVALNSVCLHANFLEFLGYYAVKCASELKDQPDSPTIFLASITNYLEKIKNLKDVCMHDYWEELDQVAAQIVVRDLEIYKGKCHSLRDPYFEIDIASEREFIIEVMNHILGIFQMSDEAKLKHEESAPNVLTPNIQKALQIIVNHHTERFYLLRDYEPINHYFHNLCTQGYTDEDFLEYCVCCTRQAVTEYNEDNNTEAPKTACGHLVEVLQHAKEDGKFTSLEKMEEAASKLIEINNERLAHKRDRCIATLLKRKLDCLENSSDSEEKSKKKQDNS